MTAGCRHELPQAGCADVGFGFGDECAFNEGKKRDLSGHIAFFNFGCNMVHIRFATRDGAVEIGTVCGEFAFVAADQLGIDFAHAEVFFQRGPQATGTESLGFGLVGEGQN